MEFDFEQALSKVRTTVSDFSFESALSKLRGGQQQQVAPLETPAQVEVKKTPVERFKEVIGKSEGGEAGYDAVFGYGGKGGDKSIPTQYGGKNISQLSIAEVLKLSEERSKQNKGAVGKYQFLSGTIKDSLKDAGLSDKDVFSPEAQDKLFDVLIKKNETSLQKSGFVPTESRIHLAHALGAAGALKVLRADPTRNLAQTLGFKGAALKTNPHLNKPIKDYIEELKGKYK
jgi:hypothetical protein